MVNDRWNEKDVEGLKTHLEMRVYSSRLLGQDAELVMHGGGNTSVKDRVRNILGEEEDVIYVKGSGWDLATIQAPGFPAVKMPHLLKLRGLNSLSDPDMMNELRTQMLDARSPDPSVETLLHAFIPHSYVDHTHADAVLALTNQPEGERWIKELYGKKVGIVPYVMPGFKLAKLCADVYEQDPSVEGLVLLKHGIFSFGATAKESYHRMIALVRQAEEFLAGRKTRSIPASIPIAPSAGAEAWMSTLRKEFMKRGKRGAFLLNTDEATLRFINRSDLRDITQRGPLTPDHVIRTKRLPCIFDTAKRAEENVAEVLNKYSEDYQAYFLSISGRKTEKLVMLDSLPRVVILPGIGLATFGGTTKDARIAMDIYEHTMKVIAASEAMSRFEALNEEDIFDVEYWVLEQAKLKLGAKTLSHSGKVAVISGGTTGIGLAIAVELLKHGADVYVLDIDQNRFEAVTSILKENAKVGNRGEVLRCNITNRTEVDNTVKKIIRERGGVDIVVANAGVFPASALVENTSSEEWSRALDINLSGTFHLISSTLPWLKQQGQGGDFVLIASKNVPAPGKEAAAYSVSKAGQVQLARVTALEAGAHGIRVNTLHPHLVFDTALWTEELLKKRAEAYGMTVEQYKKNNLLKTEISSRDVALAVLSLTGGAFSKTTGAQICVDGGSDRTL